MTNKTKYIICIAVVAVSLLALLFLKPIPQNNNYHQFADANLMMGISNFWNVISNLPFLIVAIIGFFTLKKKKGNLSSIDIMLLLGIFLTGLGSGWYHLNPNNNTLVWDRIPMTIVFMSFLSFVIHNWIGARFGKIFLFPLIALGVFSVWYWNYTESQGAGDLRLYGWVQFFPMIMIPLVLLLFKNKQSPVRELVLIILFYVLAKLAERWDKSIFDSLTFISGHSIKHLLAACSTWYIVKILKR